MNDQFGATPACKRKTPTLTKLLVCSITPAATYGSGGEILDRNNTHRSLRQIAVIRAWFDEEEGNSKRRTLHANVAFREERLGGGPESNVYFKVALKRCEVVAVLPDGGQNIRPDPRTIKSTPPKKARTVERSKNTTHARRGRLGIALKSVLNMGAEGEVSGSQEQSQSESETQTVDFFDTLHGQSRDGFPSWRVLGHESRLEGALWDAVREPLFTIVDTRPEDIIERENERRMSPSASIQIRCLREDLDVYDIEFKDEKEAQLFSKRIGKENRLRAAEAYLKRELLNEGLLFGDLSDLYSELLLADLVVPLYE